MLSKKFKDTIYKLIDDKEKACQYDKITKPNKYEAGNSYSIYYQLLEICKVMNQQPKLTKLFFNSTNQFSNCMNYCGIKNEVEINANWIIQQSQ